LPEELLYPIISSTTNQGPLVITELPSTAITEEEITDSNLMPLPQTGGIVRVPSAPGSLKYVWPKDYSFGQLQECEALAYCGIIF
jgi:hypothetical protein